jgi:hypothetical protein
MSALGHKQTFCGTLAMSALPPEADMCGATRYVRFVPIADICLFDDLVSAPDQCMGNSDPERLGSLEIYDQFDFCGLLDW